MTDDQDTGNKLSQMGIEGMSELSAAQLDSLKKLWILTIDEFVSAAATEEGRNGLGEALDLSLESLGVLLNKMRSKIGNARYEMLMTARPGGPLGALIEKPKKETSANSREQED